MPGLSRISPTLADTILSPWLVLPLAGLTLLVIGAHVLAVQVADMPAFRKRVRIVNGLVMMFVASALAYALGAVPVVAQPRAHPAQARGFVMVWLVIIALLAIVIALAVVDALGTAGSGLRKRRTLSKEMREALAANAAARAREQATKGSGESPRG